MFGELMELGLSYKEAEAFMHYTNKMVGNIEFLDDDGSVFVDEASLTQLIWYINNYNK